MGLDNGIILRRKTTNDVVKVTPEYFCVEKPDNTLCYWRKCWNIRKAFLNVLDKPDNLKNESYYLIEYEDIPAIMRGIIKLFDKDTWEESNDSIWEFDKIKEDLVTDLVNLKLLQRYLKENKDVIALFYDSY